MSPGLTNSPVFFNGLNSYCLTTSIGFTSIPLGIYIEFDFSAISFNGL